jgi:hypothetical protein
MRSPDGANGSRECAPDDRLREIRGRNQRFPDCASLHPDYGLHSHHREYGFRARAKRRVPE